MAMRAHTRRGLAYGAVLAIVLVAGWAWQRHAPNPASTATTGPAQPSASQPGRRLQGMATVFDADTIGVQGARLRLQGIDAPEYAQTCGGAQRTWPCGKEAIAALRRHLQGRSVDCAVVGTDRYQRGLVHCRLRDDQAPGDGLNRWLVRNGWAVSFGDDYVAEELLAERERAGLWRDVFVRPNRWRAQHAADRPRNATSPP